MRPLLLILLIALPTVPAFADNHLRAPDRKFDAMDVFELEYASDPQVSPDGKSVIYARRSNDIMNDRTRSNLWVASVDGQSHRPLLSGPEN